jgi:hypothetical protein
LWLHEFLAHGGPNVVEAEERYQRSMENAVKRVALSAYREPPTGPRPPSPRAGPNFASDGTRAGRPARKRSERGEGYIIIDAPAPAPEHELADSWRDA